MNYRYLAVAGTLLASTALLHAADATSVVYSKLAPVVSDYGDDDLVFEFGIGALAAPMYDGSDDYSVSPSPYFSVEYLNIPGIGSFGGKDGLGLSIGPSFAYTDDRDADDHDDLIGLDDVNATY